MKKKPKIKKYPFGGLINKGVTGIASALGANDKTAQLIGSGVATATGLIPGMQDNFIQGADFLGDAAQFSNNEDLQKAGQVASMAGGIAGKVIPMMPNGGIFQGKPNAEIEKQEMLRMPNGQTQQVDGPSHDFGGVDVSIPTGTQVFSDRLKVPGTKNTFAKEAAKYKNNKQTKILDDVKATDKAKATAKLVNDIKQKKLDALFASQEQLKASKINGYANKLGLENFAYGGTKLPKYFKGGVGPVNPDYKPFNPLLAPGEYDSMYGQAYGPFGSNNERSSMMAADNTGVDNPIYTQDDIAGNGYNGPYNPEPNMGSGFMPNGPVNPNYKAPTPSPFISSDERNRVNSERNSYTSEDINIANGFKNPNPTTYTPQESRNFTPEIEASLSGLTQMAPAIRDLYLSKWGKKYDKESYGQVGAKLLDPSESIAQANVEGRVTRNRLKDLTGGNVGGYLSNLSAAQSANTMNKAKIYKDFENANSQILNDNAWRNKDLSLREHTDTQMNKARSEDIARRAVGKLSGEGVSSYKDYKAGKMDQNTAKMIGTMFTDYKLDMNNPSHWEWVMKNYKGGTK